MADYVGPGQFTLLYIMLGLVRKNKTPVLLKVWIVSLCHKIVNILHSLRAKE